MSDRYAAIRAPTEAMVARIAQNRLRAEFNALTRERGRIQGQLRQTEYLRFQAPVSGLAAAEHALDGRLDRIGTELRDTRARLAGTARATPGEISFRPLSAPSADTETHRVGLGGVDFDDETMDQAVTNARAFVEDLLRANRSRQ